MDEKIPLPNAQEYVDKEKHQFQNDSVCELLVTCWISWHE